MFVEQQSDKVRKGRVEGVETVRYHFSDILDALESSIEYAAERKDGRHYA